jgi:ankyrin repeat protein
MNTYKLSFINKANNNYTPLQEAALNGLLDLVKILIKCGANIDGYISEDGYEYNITHETPLMLSIENGHTEVALFLLENGADPLYKEEYSFNDTFDMAFSRNNIQVITRIIDVYYRNRDHMEFNAGKYLQKCEDLKMAEILIPYVDVDDFISVFTYYVDNLNVEFVSFLIKQKQFDIQKINKHHHLILIDVINSSGDIHKINNISSLLINHGYCLDYQDDDGYTALMYAISLFNRNITDLLIKNNCDISLKNNDNKTANDIADENGYNSWINNNN